MQCLPSFMLDLRWQPNPPPAWQEIDDMLKHNRFWKLITKLPELMCINKKIFSWGRHTWGVLQNFALRSGYSVLSHQLLKFYHALQQTAVKCTSARLKYSRRHGHTTYVTDHITWYSGYELIVSTLHPRQDSHNVLESRPADCAFLQLSWPVQAVLEYIVSLTCRGRVPPADDV